MRKITTLMLLLTVAFLSSGQDIKPISPLFKNLQSPSFSFMIGGNTWIYKGSAFNPTPWTELAGWTNVKDTLTNYWSKTEITPADTARWGAGGIGADSYVTGINFTGTTTKTLMLTQVMGGTKTATFTDNDNQTLSTLSNGSTRTVTISDGNSIAINVDDHPNRTALDNVLGVNTGDQSLSGLGGVPSTTTITINGAAQDLSTDRVWNVGTVTSVATTGSVNGITLTGTVTNTGTLTLSGTLSGVENSQLANSSITINSVSISLGGTNTITADTPNSITFNNSGVGDVSGTTFNGSAVKTISYNTIGAEPAFSKNTGFNLNLGSTAGTVLEGRTFGTAAASNVGDFIVASPASPQSASINVTGQIKIGDLTDISGLSNFLLARNISGVNSAHGFSDNNVVNLSGAGYNSFDAKPTFTGSSYYDHAVAFQSIPKYESSGNIGILYGLFNRFNHNGTGIIDKGIGIYLGANSGGGIFNKIYGIITQQGAGNSGFGIDEPIAQVHINSNGITSLPASSGITPSTGIIARFSSQSKTSAILDVGNNSSLGMWIQSTDLTDLAQKYPILLNPNGGDVIFGGKTKINPNSPYYNEDIQLNNLAPKITYRADGGYYWSTMVSDASSDAKFKIRLETDGTDVLVLDRLHNATFASTIQATTAKLTNLTDGYIPYHISDASGLGNSPIYTDGTIVGIGTTAPSGKLEVKGAGVVDILINRDAITGYARLGFKTNSVSKFFLGMDNDLTPSADVVGLFDTGGNGLFLKNGGNVGIGYSTGTEITNNKLAVNGSGHFDGLLTVNNISSDKQAVFGDGARDIYINGKTITSENKLITLSAISGGNRMGLYDDKLTILANGNADHTGTVNSTGYLLGNHLKLEGNGIMLQAASAYEEIAFNYTGKAVPFTFFNGSGTAIASITNAGIVNTTGYLLNGNNLFSSLSTGYLPYWDGTKFLNSISSIAGTEITTSGSVKNIANLSGWGNWIENQKTDGTGSGAIITAANNTGGINLYLRKQDGTDILKAMGTGKIIINDLASTNARLLSASSTGQLTPITDGTGFIKSNGSGVWSYDNSTYSLSSHNHEVISLLSTGAGANQVATANGSNAVTFQTLKTINSTSLLGTGNITAGDVSKVGTPATTQLGIWTGDGTIKGVSNLSFTDNTTYHVFDIKSPAPVLKLSDSDYSPVRNSTIEFDGSVNSLRFYNYDGTSTTALAKFTPSSANLYTLSNATAANILYYDPATGLLTYANAPATSGMVWPTGSGIPIVASGTSWGTTIALPGGTTSFLRGDGTFATPTFTSQWTTDTNGITYANNVGIGIASASNIGLYVSKATSNSGYISYMNNTNANAGGLGIQVAANSSAYPILTLLGNTSTTRFNFLSDGTFYASSAIGNTTTPYNLYFDPANGKITYGSASGGGGVSSVSASTITTGTGGNFATVTVTNPTTTPAIAYSLSSQTANLHLASPNGASGVPSYRKIEIADHSATGTPSSSTFYRGDNTWATVASGGIPYPAGSGIAIVSGGSSWGTTITLPGGTTSFLRADGTFATPSGSYSLPLAANGTRGGVQIGYTGGSSSTIPVQLSSEKAYVTLTRTSIESAYPIQPNVGTTLDTSTDSNLRHTTLGDITITISNLIEGRTGNIEITYGGAGIVTFNVGSGNVLNVAPNIYSSTTNAYTKSVLTKSSGTAIYSYYMSGTNVYLTGTQSWN